MKVLACFTLAQVLLAVFSARVQTAPLADQVSASETADLRCNEIMKALSANNYAAATAHFDPAMKASSALSGSDRYGGM